MKTIFIFLAVCALGLSFSNTESLAQQRPQRPSTTGTVRPSTNGTVRPSTNGTVRPSTTGTLRPSTTGTVRPSTNGTVRPSTNGTVRPSTTGTIRPSTTGTVRPDTTRREPRDTTRPQPRDTVSALVVRVFPNPASVRLAVGYNNLPPTTERVIVRILNIMGEEVAQQTVGANENEVIFDVSRLREGQYAVVVHAGRAVGRAVVIIRH